MTDKGLKTTDLGYAPAYLVRCQHNRTMPDGDGFWDEVTASKRLGRIRFELPAERGRPALSVEQKLLT